MPVHCQGMHRADVPAVNRFEGTSSSKKVPQDHKIVRKVRKRTDDPQYEWSAIFTMRLENLCECGSWIFQIEIMGAFFGVSLTLLRSGIRCHGERCQSFELNQGVTVVMNGTWRRKRPIQPNGIIFWRFFSIWSSLLVSVPTLRSLYFQFPIWRIICGGVVEFRREFCTEMY